jgi:hypothetical protein
MLSCTFCIASAYNWFAHCSAYSVLTSNEIFEKIPIENLQVGGKKCLRSTYDNIVQFWQDEIKDTRLQELAGEENISSFSRTKDSSIVLSREGYYSHRTKMRKGKLFV